MKKLYESLSLTLAMMLMLASVALAQERVVTGTVADETGTGMPGVNVLVKGTPQGTVTDAQGGFSISAAPEATLVFTFVGYKTTEVAVGDRTSINVAMEVDLTSLDEVVVTGYSVDNRRAITGAVSTVKTKDLTVYPQVTLNNNCRAVFRGNRCHKRTTRYHQPDSRSRIWSIWR